MLRKVPITLTVAKLSPQPPRPSRAVYRRDGNVF